MRYRFNFFVPIFAALLAIDYNSCRQARSDGFHVTSIDSNILHGYYYIEILRSGKVELILSEKSTLTCTDSVQVGKKYNLPLNLIYTTPKIDSMSFRLYKNDIHLDGNLVFPKAQKVYKSNSIVGLCIERS